MKRMLGIALVISGAVFSVFVLNLMLYSFVPAYRAALLISAAGKDSSIPVIEVETEVNPDMKSEAIAEMKENEDAAITTLQDQTTPLAPIFEETSSKEEKNSKKIEENKPQIIERTYYEDCGTGHGYWVLKYSDGSFGIE